MGLTLINLKVIWQREGTKLGIVYVLILALVLVTWAWQEPITFSLVCNHGQGRRHIYAGGCGDSYQWIFSVLSLARLLQARPGMRIHD